MPTRYFNVVADEDAAINAGQVGQQQRSFASSDDEAIAQRLSSIGDSVPWLSPDAALSLAQAGIDGNDPAINEIAKAAGKSKTKKKGFGWHTIGDVVTSPGRSSAGKWIGNNVGGALGATGHYAGNVVRPVTRTADLALSAPLQAAQGQFRNIVTGDWKEALKFGVAGLDPTSFFGMKDSEMLNKVGLDYKAPTTLGVTMDQLATGKKVELGSGFFASGKNKTEQTNRARAGGTIDGHAITPGRWLASSVLRLEPGTMPANTVSGLTDAAVSWFADPSSKGMKALGETRAASKLFSGGEKALDLTEKAGLVNATRKTVMADRAESWLQSDMGRKVVQKSAEGNFTDLRNAFGKKMPTETLVKLADAKTEQEVLDVLRPRLGITIREKPTVPGRVDDAIKNVTETITRRPLKDIRMLQEMPARTIDLDDLDHSVETVEKFAQNAKLPAAIRQKHVEAMARANGRIGRYQALNGLLTDVTAHLGEEAGMDRSGARKLTRMFENYDERLRAYFVNETGENMPVIGAKIDGNGFVLPTPHVYSEYVNRALPMPDPRHIRNATSKFGRLLNTRDIEITLKGGKTIKAPLPVDQTHQVAEWLTSDVFKKLVLLRPAYPVRVVGEEQMRMAGSGLHSMFSHPLSYISYLAGRKGNLDFMGNDIKTASQLAGDMDEFASALSRGSDYNDRANIVRGARTHFRLENVDNREDYITAWADELMRLRGDELSRRVAGDWNDAKVPDFLMQGSNVEKAKWYFREGAGRTIREDLAQADGRQGLLDDVAQMDGYIDSLLQRVDVKTQANPDLIRAISSGHLPDGEPIRDGMRASDKFIEYLRRQADDGLAPAIVAGDMKYSPGSTLSNRVLEAYDTATGALFNHLASKPTNYFSRSPAFMQFLWKRGEELIGFMDEAAQAKFLKGAEEANLGKSVLKRMREAADASKGDLSLEEAELLSKLHAADSTKKLLFDYTQRSQFFDAYRLIFPFGDAWKEVLTAWGRIATENPSVIRRGQQVITAGRQADPDNDGQGFFYKDPTTGVETFAYPFSRHITEALLGTPIPLTAPVNGLNIFGSVLPGTGPVVQFAAGAMLPDIPEFDQIHKMIFPYGEVDREQGGVVESYFPAWFQKLRQSGYTPFGKPDERLFNNTVGDIATQLFGEGKFDPNDPASVQDAFEEAKHKAKWLYVLRGLAQSAVPSPPSPEFLVHDQSGRLTAMDMLVGDLHTMQQDTAAGGYSTANKRFLEKYGDDVFLLLQSKSESPFPATKAGRDWARQQPELAKRFPDVYGFFAPRDDKFNIDAYGAQFRSGERKALTPDEVKERASSKLAGIIWAQAKSKVEGRNDDAAMQWKRGIYDQLINTYPGFGQEFNPNKTRTAILQLQEAMKNEQVQKTDAGKGLAMYFEARENALTTAKARGLTKLDGNKNGAYLRAWLRDIGTQIEREHPDFGDMWDRVLSREVEEQETANGN